MIAGKDRAQSYMLKKENRQNKNKWNFKDKWNSHEEIAAAAAWN